MKISRTLTLTLLASSLILALIYSAEGQTCPSGCSGHGSCHFGVCTCDNTHGGVDCSYNDVPINAGDTLNGQINWGKWQFYHFTLNSNNGVQDFTLIVNETGRWSDCDVFIQRNAYPTRNSYLKSDISAKTNVALTVSNAQFGTYYAGIYGFSFARCEFNIQLVVSAACPGGCSGHGSCNRGVCTCDSGFAGSDCSAVGTQLSNGQATSQTSVTRWKWMYYYVSISAPANYLRFTLTQQSGDADLYVKKNKLPTTTSWDYLNITQQSTSIINIATPSTTDKYYIGVFGFTASSFTLRADWDVASGGQLDCPSSCSMHGTCNGGSTCNCYSGYSGSKCQNSTAPLQVGGKSAVGFVAQNDWNYYFFNYMSSQAITVNVYQTTSQNSDCDVYIRKNQIPTRFQFDYYSISPGQNSSVNVPNPGSNTWWIGIFGWWPCNYTLSLLDTKGCNCGGHGTCRSGSNVCVCSPGWAGPTCSSQLVILDNHVAVNDAVSNNQWNYYTFSVPAAVSNVGFFLKEVDDTTGYVFLYISIGGTPSILNSDYKDTNQTSSLHVINIDNIGARSITYNIGVYGSPYQPPASTIRYSIVAYRTPF